MKILMTWRIFHSISVWPSLFKGLGGRVSVLNLPWTIFVKSGVRPWNEEEIRLEEPGALQRPKIFHCSGVKCVTFHWLLQLGGFLVSSRLSCIWSTPDFAHHGCRRWHFMWWYSRAQRFQETLERTSSDFVRAVWALRASLAWRTTCSCWWWFWRCLVWIWQPCIISWYLGTSLCLLM